MTAKEYLKQYRYATQKVARLQEEYDKELELIDSVRSSANVDGMPRAFNINRSVEDRAIRLALRAAKLKEAELDAIAIRQEVFNVVIDIPGAKGDILYYRYIRLVDKWDDICKMINYEWAQTHRLHAEALADAEIIIKQRGLFKHETNEEVETSTDEEAKHDTQ